MDLYKRYIPCKCLQVGNDFIPFWQLNWVKNEFYGEGFYPDNKNQYDASYSDLVDCYWDSNEKKIILGIIKDVYPEKLAHKIDDVVLVEVDSQTYLIDTIVDIIYEEYDTTIIKVENTNDPDLEWYFSTEEIKGLKPNDLYEIRSWKPTYKTKDGKTIKWDYQIKKLAQPNAKLS